MRLQLTISLFISLIFFCGVSFSQENLDQQHVDSPYRTEYNPWFELGIFKRGFKNEPLTAKLDSLETKPRKYWTRNDSLIFAEVTKKTGNYELSAYYFDNLKVDYKTEEKFWWERLVLHFLMREFNSCNRMIREAEPGLVEHSKLWFFHRICDAKLRQLKDEKWHKHGSVLNWEIDSSLLVLDKDDELFKEKVITPLENLRFVLELLIRHIYDNDEVIARTCLEMGWILDAYISKTEAFIAFSLARNYDNWDKEILGYLKEEKAKLIEKNYRIPIFRKHFPRVETWRFDYELLKEKIIYERNDTLEKTQPVLRKKSEQISLAFNPQLIVIGGVALIFLLLLILLKVKKKQTS